MSDTTVPPHCMIAWRGCTSFKQFAPWRGVGQTPGFGFIRLRMMMTSHPAYIVGDFPQERIKSILDLAISRFNAFSRLQDELDRTRSALEERKVIDRAKGILMNTKKLSEENAYALLRKAAMNENKKIVDVA